MLLLLFAGGQGLFIWTGPVASRTVLIEAEVRRTQA